MFVCLNSEIYNIYYYQRIYILPLEGEPFTTSVNYLVNIGDSITPGQHMHFKEKPTGYFHTRKEK